MSFRRSGPRTNPPLERTAAVYFTCHRASRVRRRGRSTALRYMASALEKSEVLTREWNASPGSFVAGVRFDLRWDAGKFSALCEALQAATKEYAGRADIPRDLSQLFWYCGTFIPMFVQQRDFTVGQSHVNYDKACSLLKRLGDAWFADDSLLTDDDLASKLAAI